jgi:hypothetical protein
MKNKIHLPAIIIGFLLVFNLTSGCQKVEKNFGLTTYKGRVIERGSTVGISNCPIIIHGYESGGFWGSPSYPIVGETYSDSDGYYSITWNAIEGEDYYIYPESRKHYGSGKGQPIWELKTFGKTVTKDLEQWAFAFVKMKLLNRHKYKDYDDITFGSNFSGITLYPQSKDTTLLTSIWANLKDSVGFTLYKGRNQILNKRFGFLLNARQVDSINIEY